MPGRSQPTAGRIATRVVFGYTANVYVTLPIGVPNMTTTIELFDAAKLASGCATDYQFGKRYSIKQSTMSNWRTGNRNLDDDHAALFARILGRDEGELLAILGDEDCEFCGQILCREQEDILSPICPTDELSRLRRRVMVLELVLEAATVPTSRQRSERSPATAPASR